jgi:branched-subunit amino acid transport protein
MTANELILISGMALVTFLIRYPAIALSGRLKLSERWQQGLTYVPPAVLTAIIVPMVLVDGGVVWMSAENPRLVGAIAAFGVGLWRKNLLLTIAVGMATFMLWQAL